MPHSDLTTILGALILDAVRFSATLAIAIAALDGVLLVLAAFAALWVAGNVVTTRVAPDAYAAAAQATGRAASALFGRARGFFAR